MHSRFLCCQKMSNMGVYTLFMLTCLLINNAMTAKVKVQNKLAAKIDDLAKIIEMLNGKVTGLNGKMDGLNNTVTGLIGKVAGLDDKVKGLDVKVAGVQTACTTRTGTEDSSCCTDGWSKLGSSCYHFGASDLAFQDAETFCVGIGAHLANIESASENALIQDVLKQLKAPNHWIGMVDEQTEGIWKFYPSGKTATFLAWGGGEPNQGRVANCIAIWASYAYMWVDEPCANRFRPICEKPIN